MTKQLNKKQSIYIYSMYVYVYIYSIYICISTLRLVYPKFSCPVISSTLWGFCSVISKSEGCKYQAVQVKTSAASAQTAPIDLELAHGGIPTDAKKSPNPMTRRRLQGGSPARKATFDKYSTWKTFEGQALAGCSRHTPYLQTRADFPWWDQRLGSALPMGTAPLRSGWNNIPAKQGFRSSKKKKKKKAGRGNILMSHKEHFLPRGTLRKSH